MNGTDGETHSQKFNADISVAVEARAMTAPRIPTQKECLNPVMKALHAHGGSATNEQIYSFVVKELALSAEQLAVPARKRKSSKLNRVAFNVNFAKTLLKNVGYLIQPRRTEWELTDLGLASPEIDPEDVIKKNSIFYKERKLQKQRSTLAANTLKQSDDESKALETVAEPLIQPEMYSASALTHDEIQWLLLLLGNEMKLDLWVATNDRGKSFQGNKFSDLRRLRQNLPVQFGQRTQRIIELIDVLWLQGNSIVAAFEIEHTTSIYSGLLRMSDLIALQPNLNIDLYIVAPDDRRDKVKSEINRPSFENAGLPRHCRYIAYSKLTTKFDQAKKGGFLHHLSPTFLNEISERMD